MGLTPKDLPKFIDLFGDRRGIGISILISYKFKTKLDDIIFGRFETQIKLKLSR